MPLTTVELLTVPAALTYPNPEIAPHMETPYQRVIRVSSAMGEAACKYTGDEDPITTRLDLTEAMALQFAQFVQRTLAHYEPGVDDFAAHAVARSYQCYNFATLVGQGQKRTLHEARQDITARSMGSLHTSQIPEGVTLPLGTEITLLDRESGYPMHAAIALGQNDERTLQVLNTGGHIGLVTYKQLRHYYTSTIERRTAFYVTRLPKEQQPDDLHGFLGTWLAEVSTPPSPGRRRA